MSFISDQLGKITKTTRTVINKTTDRPEDPLASNWKRRVRAADDYFEQWQRKFKCKLLEDYYEGKQWRENDQYEPYIINMFYSTIEVKKPSLLFTEPLFHIKPKPSKAEYNLEAAAFESQLLEDTLNSFLADKNLMFGEEIDMSILDSWAYFSIVEVGYGAEWINNPNAGKPVLKSDYTDEFVEHNGQILKQPEQIPEKEWIYVKRIPAHRFRVGGFDSAFLRRNNWVGYYEFVRIEDLFATPGFIGLKDESAFPGVSRSEEFLYDPNENQTAKQGDLVKIWKIWDLRAKEFFILRDSPSKIIFKPEKFDRLPLFDLRFVRRRKGWYPIPVTYNWKSPQDEINEAREMNRAHRRKARSLFQAKLGSVDEDELDKMLSGPDQSVILTKQDGAVKPIQSATLDPSIGTSLNVTKDDFIVVSGTTADLQPGVADRVTATSTVAANQRASVRENAEQVKVAEWLCEIAKEVLLQVREKFTLPFWIKLNVGPTQEQDQIEQITQSYKLIESEDLGELDFDVQISIESMSPVTNQQEKQKLYELLAIISQYPLIGAFPDLIRECAYRIGYRNERVVRSMIQMAQLSVMRQANADTGGATGPVGPENAPGNGQAAQNMVANATPPTAEAVRNQLGGQIQ